MTVTFNPTSLAFGDKMVGDSETRSVTITNNGNASVDISPSASGGYQVLGTYDSSGKAVTTPYALAPGASATVTVRFSPASVGSFAGTLSAGGSSASLSGAGVAATIDTPINEEIDPAGTPTRFQIAVPTFTTTLTMGRGVVGSTYNGFGVTTDENIFFNAGTSASDSTSMFWAQASGDVVTQSINANVFSIAKSNHATVGVSSASLVGGGGVFISSGISVDPSRADAASPPASTAFSSLSEASARASIALGLFDGVLALAVGIRGFYLLSDAAWIRGPANKIANTWLSLPAAAAGLAAFSMGVASAVAAGNALRSSDQQVTVNLPGTTIYGQGGVLVGTPAFCSIYGAAGLVLGSAFPFIFGLDAEMLGIKSATITAIRDATVQSSKKATLKSSKKVDIAAKETITIGVGPQLLDNPPQKIEMTQAGGISIRSDTLDISAPNGVTIAGPLTHIALDAGQLRIRRMNRAGAGHGGAPESASYDVVLNRARFSVTHDQAIEMNCNANITLRANTGQAAVDLNAAGAAIAGNRIQLG